MISPSLTGSLLSKTKTSFYLQQIPLAQFHFTAPGGFVLFPFIA